MPDRIILQGPITLYGPDLMTPGEVAVLFGVNVKTVTRWANAGRLTCTRTPGNTRRYHKAGIEALLNSGQPAERAA